MRLTSSMFGISVFTVLLLTSHYFSFAQQPVGTIGKLVNNGKITQRLDSIFSNERFELKVTSYLYQYQKAILDNALSPEREFRSDAKSMGFTLYFTNAYDSVYFRRIKDFKWTFEGLPDEMIFDKNLKQLVWEKPYIKAGNFTIKARVTNGIFADSLIFKFKVNEEWKTTLLPGINGVYYAPADKSLGYFTGVGVEYLFYGGIHKNNNTGPSHSKVYMRLDMMNSSIDTVGLAFLFNLGVHLSVERNPIRKFFVPYFGFECGSVYQRLSGTTFQVTPLIGVWLFSEQNTFISAQFGYLYAAGALETLRGYRAGVGINFSLW